MVDRIVSIIKRIYINVERGYDHIYRKITGFPTIKRSLITSSLYLGGQYKISALHRLSKYGVTAIVNMRTTPIPDEVKKLGIRTLHLPTQDLHAPTLKQLHEGVAFIQKEIDNQGKVYIHCHLGEGRGPTMVIAYLISTGLTLTDAFEEVRAVRKFIQPTTVQLAQLKKFESLIKRKN